MFQIGVFLDTTDVIANIRRQHLGSSFGSAHEPLRREPAMVAVPRLRRIHLVPRVLAALLLGTATAVIPATAAAAADVTDGLVVRYDLDQTTGTAVPDTSGNGRGGVLRGDAAWAPGGGLTLGGTDGHVDLPDNVLAGLQQITVSADVRIDPAQPGPYMIWALGNTDSAGVGNGYLFATGDSYRTSIATGN
jgi:hypothetical protein